MKKILCLLSSLLICMSIAVFPAFAAEENIGNKMIVVNGLNFRSEEGNFWFDSVADTSMTTITFPDTINGEKAYYEIAYTDIFKDCKNLKEFICETDQLYAENGVLFGDDVTSYMSYGTENNWKQVDGKTLLAYPPAKEDESYHIPEDVVLIRQWAFSHCTNLKSVTVPPNVEFVCKRAFNDCNSLEEIHGCLTVNSSLAVSGCEKLHSLSFRGTLAEFRLSNMPDLTDINFSDDTVFAYHDGMYQTNFWISDCNQLKKINLPPRVDNDTFQVKFENCEQLEKVTLNGFFGAYVELTNLPALNTLEFRKETPFSVAFSVTDCPNMMVYGLESDSQLQTACSKQSLTFSPLSITTGDIDGSGIVDVVDVLVLNKYLLGIHELNNSGRKSADVDHDGYITDADAMKILKSLVGLETLE